MEYISDHGLRAWTRWSFPIHDDDVYGGTVCTVCQMRLGLDDEVPS